MARIVDELITVYRAVDQHTSVAKVVAQAQLQLTRAHVDATKTREAATKILRDEARMIEAGVRVQRQSAVLAREESKERTAVAKATTAESAARAASARAVGAEIRLREQLIRVQEREERATRRLSASRRFANGFGSTRLNLGAASPLISSFTRGGFAGGMGALAATGIGAGVSALGALGSAALGGLQNGLGALGGFGDAAMNAAMEASSREARLTAILRSQQKAQEVLRMVEKVAAPSTATTKQLADAATTLEAFGVNSLRAIPIIGKLATAMGAGEEQMQMYARAIGQLGTGNMIDADVMAAMGLQRRDFAAQGIKFDGNGKLLSSAQEAMAALEKIVGERFGNIFDQMKDTPEAKRASLMDAGERALRIIGDGMLRAQGPIVDALTKNLNAAVDSGILQEVVARATGDVFKYLKLGEQGEMVTGLMARVLAFIEVVPGNVAKGIAFLRDFTTAAIANAIEFFKVIEDRATRFSARLTLMVGQATILADGMARATAGPFGIPNPAILSQTFRDIASAGQAGEAAIGSMKEYAPKYQGFPGLPSFSGVSGGRVGEIEARLREAMNKPGGGIPDVSGQAFLRRALTPEGQALEEIATNTREMADKTVDLREVIFGGSGNRKGISIADVLGGGGGGRSGGRSGGRITIQGDRAADKIKDALWEVVAEALPQIESVFLARSF